MRIGIDIDNKEHYKRSSVYVIIEREEDNKFNYDKINETYLLLEKIETSESRNINER